MTKINLKEASETAAKLGIKFEKFSAEEFCNGMNIELEHGSVDPETNVTNNDLIMTGKIAWAHLKEFPDYYERLDKLEEEAEAFWNK